MITADEANRAKAAPVKVTLQSSPNQLAPWFTEEIRRYLEKKYGTSAVHEGGLKVYSSLNVEMQKSANAAVRAETREYDKRHGWRGADRNLIDQGVTNLETVELPDWKLTLQTVIQRFR